MTAISHDQARQYMQPGIAAQLTDAQRATLDAHLAACPACRAEAEALAALDARLAGALHARWDGVQPAKDPFACEAVQAIGATGIGQQATGSRHRATGSRHRAAGIGQQAEDSDGQLETGDGLTLPVARRPLPACPRAVEGVAGRQMPVARRPLPVAFRRSLGFAGGVAGLALIAALIALLAGPFAQVPTSRSMATPLPGTTPTLVPFDVKHNPGVADLLADRPPAGQSVEIDAYFDSAGAPSMLGPRARSLPDQVVCPGFWEDNLTDRPYPAVLQYLSTMTGNALPDDAPWLIAATPEQTRPGATNFPELPYHARLRGHFDDPAFAQCEHTDRIFVVEAVVQVYEQDLPDPSIYTWAVPQDLATWPRFADAAQGYSIPYPPDWQALRLDERTVAFYGPSWPGNPITVSVHAGETHLDQYDPANMPPLLQGNNTVGVYMQSNLGPDPGYIAVQGLDGYQVEREPAGAGTRGVAVLFSGGGNTYEIALDFPTGFAAAPELLKDYTAMVEGFRLDALPGPSPTPPVKDALGAGPFLTQWQAVARAPQPESGPLSLFAAQLVSEAAARAQADACSTFETHPDGVWVLKVYGQFEGEPRTLRLFVDAVTGEYLCGEQILETQPRWSEYETALVAAWLPFAPHGLCEWDLLGQAPGEAYVWAYCVAMGTEVESAVSAPAVVRIGADGRVTGVEVPGDGTHYAPDIKRLFPADVQALIFAYTGDTGAWAASLAARKVQAGPPLIAVQGTQLP